MLQGFCSRAFKAGAASYRTVGLPEAVSFSLLQQRTSPASASALQLEQSLIMREEDVGITEWTNDLPGFTGILKQR